MPPTLQAFPTPDPSCKRSASWSQRSPSSSPLSPFPICKLRWVEMRTCDIQHLFRVCCLGPGSGSSISLWLADTNSAPIPDCNLLLITQTCHPAGWQRSSNNANYPRFSFTGHRGNGHPHDGAWKLNRTHRTCVVGGESVGPPTRNLWPSRPNRPPRQFLGS
jgi:hypothetical protein